MKLPFKIQPSKQAFRASFFINIIAIISYFIVIGSFSINDLGYFILTFFTASIVLENFLTSYKTRLEEISSKYSLFSEIRSSGLWFGCDLVKEKSSFEFLDIAYGEGLILVPAGSDKIRLAPALNIENEDILEQIASKVHHFMSHRPLFMD